MNVQSKDVHDHFEKLSGAFDGIYEGEQNSFLYRVVDALFRRSILERRLKLTLALSGDVRGKDILDIGCGPGRYSVMFAKDKPNLVLGVDISDLMIGLATNLAAVNNVGHVCRFEKCDFMRRDFDRAFDVIVAAGVFDYTPDPRPYLMKIKKELKGKAVLSFPVKWTLFTPVRIAWLRKRGCPNFYYSRRDVTRLLKECGLTVSSIKKVGSFLVPGNYIAVCNP